MRSSPCAFDIRNPKDEVFTGLSSGLCPPTGHVGIAWFWGAVRLSVDGRTSPHCGWIHISGPRAARLWYLSFRLPPPLLNVIEDLGIYLNSA